MFRITKFLFLYSCASLLAALPLQAESDRALTQNSITVGCNGKACLLTDGNRRSTRGFYLECKNILTKTLDNPKLSALSDKEKFEKAIQAIQNKMDSLRTHNHPGITIDLQPKSSWRKGPHIKQCWFDLDLEENTYDKILFEQLPPTGLMYKGNDVNKFQESNDFLPRAIEKARKHLIPHGKLIIHLALDADMDARRSKEDLKNLREANPFMGYFNDVTPQLKQTLEKEGAYGPPSLVKATQFYLNIMQKRLDETRTLICEDLNIPSFYILDKLNRYLDLKHAAANKTPREVIKKDPDDIAATIFGFIIIFRQGDMMINYLNKHGFRDAKLEWLDIGEHEYHPAAGWFLTAAKK